MIPSVFRDRPEKKECMQAHCRELIRWIETLFQEGVVVDAAACDFIDATLSNPSADELAALVTGPSNPERDTLCELLFFPDEAMQVRLEPLLERNAYAEEDARIVAEAIGRRSPEVTLRFEDRRAPLRVRFPTEAAESFVGRLNITVRIDPWLRRRIEAWVASGLQVVVKVTLRNARRMPGKNQRDFLCDYIQKQATDPEFLADLSFLLGVMEEFDESCDMYRSLNEKKRAVAVHLIKQQRFEARLKNETMETLLAGGERFPYVDKAAVLETIDRIDRICIGLWGRTEPVGDLVQTEDRIQCTSVDDLKALVHRLR
jgi:hypothetical protein